MFSIEMQKLFTGYYDPENDWNGWDRPYFEWNEALKIMAWVNAWSGRKQLKIDEARKVLVYLEDPVTPFIIDGVLLQTDEGEKSLYAVGTGRWIWQAST